jgi:glycosyltransferase involved in cell wall biosynthesis
LVVVDDGEDQVADLVSGLAAVRHLALRQRTSIGAKRNLACVAARGRVIAHWDDDDWYGPTRLSAQVAPLLAGEAEVTGLENACQLELATGEFWRTTPELHRRLFVGDLHGGTLVYWKRLFDEGLRYPDVNLAEDAMFLRQVQRRSGRWLRLANPGLFIYIRHGRNAWRFATGQFLDRDGWRRVPRPEAFPEPVLKTYRLAASFAEDR